MAALIGRRDWAKLNFIDHCLIFSAEKQKDGNRWLARSVPLSILLPFLPTWQTKNRSEPTDHGRPGSKHHVATDANGTALAVILPGINRNDYIQLEPLVAAADRSRNRKAIMQIAPMTATNSVDCITLTPFLHRSLVGASTTVMALAIKMGRRVHPCLAARISPLSCAP